MPEYSGVPLFATNTDGAALSADNDNDLLLMQFTHTHKQTQTMAIYLVF